MTIDLSNDKQPLREPVDSTKYRQAIGRLMYLMVCTRPDIASAIGQVSRFLENPGKLHWEAVKRIFKYLKSTQEVEIK